jgi:hypothetical protein
MRLCTLVCIDASLFRKRKTKSVFHTQRIICGEGEACACVRRRARGGGGGGGEGREKTTDFSRVVKGGLSCTFSNGVPATTLTSDGCQKQRETALSQSWFLCRGYASFSLCFFLVFLLMYQKRKSRAAPHPPTHTQSR